MNAIIIVGIILIIASLGLLWFRQNSAKKLQDIRDTETSKIDLHIETSQGIAKDMGSGYYAQYTEIKGAAVTDRPMISQFTKKECVYYRSQVTREWQEEVEDTDSKTGETRRRMERRSEVMADNVNSPDFWVDDGTGKLKIRPSGSQIEAMQVFDSFMPQNDPMLISKFNLSFLPHTNTIGYRLKEWIIPTNQSLYIIGEISDKDGELSLKKPQDKRTFIVSTKSENELIESSQKKILLATIGAIICFILGLFCLTYFFAYAASFAYVGSSAYAGETPLIKEIKFEKGTDEIEKVYFFMNARYFPQILPIEDKDFKLVCDFPNVKLNIGISSHIKTNGNLIRSIRVGIHQQPKPKIRVVLDLVSKKDYAVEPLFYEKEKIFAIEVKLKK
ncbi:MAG: AMIN domain-containing protein [Desulfobacterales bacterium]|nr:AMIN domain-containing protein [Desulfobacterales bacterium]MBF0396978.1 AMIN domain-containing protein [Desulfobacterales bacterium]